MTAANGHVPIRKRVPGHVPVKRNIEVPSDRQTKYFGKAGPGAVVCIHAEKGFLIGWEIGTTAWSHDPDSLGWLAAGHPDLLRAAASWPSEASARSSLAEVLSFEDWMMVAFAKVRCDVATAPPAEASNADPVPIARCSIEQCSAATGMFPARPHHLLQPNMIRR